MIEITSEDVARVEKILHDVPGGAERALSNAMNRGLSKVRTAAFKEVRGVYNVQNAALKAATIRLFNIPFHTGKVPAKRFFQFSIKCVLGANVKPACNSPFDLVALIKRK